MSILRFSDGEQFDTSGELRIERTFSGWYVCGWNSLVPVNGVEEARETIKKMKESSCSKSCGPSDWYRGGKCDNNGCYEK